MEITIISLMWVISILLIIFWGLAIYIILKNKSNQRKNRFIEDEINRIVPIWYDYLILKKEIELDQLIPNTKLDILATEKTLISYSKGLTNPTVLEGIKDFSNCHLSNYYCGELKSKKWSRRLNALFRIYDFRIESLLNECKLIDNRKGCSVEERHQIYKIYSRLDFNYFKKKLESNELLLSEFEYIKLFNSLSEGSLKDLLSIYNNLNKVCQLSLISIIGSKHLIDILPFLESQLTHEDQEIRIRTLKAIYESGCIINLTVYLPFITSASWEERLMVTKLLARLPIESTFSYYQQLLGDESWWVRSEAAKCVNEIKYGKSKLQDLLNLTSDKFTIDMIKEVLGKEKLNDKF